MCRNFFSLFILSLCVLIININLINFNKSEEKYNYIFNSFDEIKKFDILDIEELLNHFELDLGSITIEYSDTIKKFLKRYLISEIERCDYEKQMVN